MHIFLDKKRDDLLKIEETLWKPQNGYWVGNANKSIGVLLSAGIHPREDSWIYTLNEMLSDNTFLSSHTGLKYKVVPCRNERGFRFLEFAKERKMKQVFSDKSLCAFTDDEEYFFLLKDEKLNEGYLLERIIYKLNDENFEGLFGVLAKTDNSNIVCNSYLYLDGKIIDFNSYCNEIDKYTMYSRNQMLNNGEIIWIDFHESIGYETFVYVDKQDELAYSIAREYVSFCKRNRIRIRNKAVDRMMIDEGIFDISFMKNRYKSNCQELIIETGIANKWSEKISLNKLIINYLCGVLEKIL